jgi:hypothetical protein
MVIPLRRSSRVAGPFEQGLHVIVRAGHVLDVSTLVQRLDLILVRHSDPTARQTRESVAIVEHDHLCFLLHLIARHVAPFSSEQQADAHEYRVAIT